MYSVATADKPIPRWQSIVYGWYLPACLALAWLTSPLWLKSAIMLLFDFRISEIIAESIILMRTAFIASLVLNSLILWLLKPKNYLWICSIWFVGLSMATALYETINRSVMAGNIPALFNIRVPGNHYSYNAAAILIGFLLSVGCMVVQYVLNPKAYPTKRMLLVAGLALAIIATCSVSIKTKTIDKPRAISIDAF